jgi:hypothetical protein
VGSERFALIRIVYRGIGGRLRSGDGPAVAFWGAGVSWATQAGANGGLTQACGSNTGQVDLFRGAGPLMQDISAWPARACR